MQLLTLISAVLSFAAVLRAQTNGQNSITYPLGGTLNSGTALTIRWTPSTTGTITLQLLKGPPANIVSVAVVASSIENTGSYTWTIPNTLQDSSSMPSGDRYGFKIIDDATSTFEYSPPFDISVPDSTFSVSGSASKSASATATSTKSTSTVSSTSTESTTTSESTSTAGSTTTSQSTITTSSESTSLSPATTGEPATTATAAVATTFATKTSATAASATGTAGNSSVLEFKKGPNIIFIIGIAAGAVVFLGVITALVLICRYRSRHK